MHHLGFLLNCRLSLIIPDLSEMQNLRLCLRNMNQNLHLSSIDKVFKASLASFFISKMGKSQIDQYSIWYSCKQPKLYMMQKKYMYFLLYYISYIFLLNHVKYIDYIHVVYDIYLQIENENKKMFAQLETFRGYDVVDSMYWRS